MDITTNLTNFSDRDKQAAKYIIGLHNAPIIAENERKAALEPPEEAAPLLPSGTAGEIKTSYETLFVKIMQNAHESYIQQADEAARPTKDEWLSATDAQRQAARAALKG